MRRSNTIAFYLLFSLLIHWNCAPERERTLVGPIGPIASFAMYDEPVLPFVVVNTLDRHLSCLLDTGSTHHILDSAYSSYLIPRTESILRKTADGSNVTFKSFLQPDMFLGPARLLPTDYLLIADLQNAATAIGEQFDGLLGVPVFEQFIIKMDPDLKRVDLFSSGSFSRIADGVTITLEQSADQFVFALSVKLILGNDQCALFGIDTGDDSTGVISRATFEILASRGYAEVVRDATVVTAGGSARLSLVRVKSCQLGPFAHNDLIFRLGQFNALGMRYLSRFVVTVDAPNRKLNLKPSSSYNIEDWPAPKSGLYLNFCNGNVSVVDVDAGSKAAQAGFLKGDIILLMPGVDGNEHRLARMRRVLGEAAGLLEIIVRRGDHVLSLTLSL